MKGRPNLTYDQVISLLVENMDEHGYLTLKKPDSEALFLYLQDGYKLEQSILNDVIRLTELLTTKIDLRGS